MKFNLGNALPKLIGCGSSGVLNFTVFSGTVYIQQFLICCPYISHFSEYEIQLGLHLTQVDCVWFFWTFMNFMVFSGTVYFHSAVFSLLSLH